MSTSKLVVEVEVDGEWNRSDLLLAIVASVAPVVSVVELEHDGYGGYERDETTRITMSIE